ncbi:hypothetical protein [Nocardioides acrostichi]|uniref:Uncharacterized protein n=1 Tax=Nocardioides acrostichi TaxID=2784339 RepID=A0A930V488_9ACTN|nr:hypothetical protein [Nocardioides acrostichi]MBF4163709.1 hypothetical protein [Nocardioides acrostichi]
MTDHGVHGSADHAGGEARAWAWVAHLRDGGTTPWAQWAGTGERTGRVLPGAQQLELLRRLNLIGSPDAALAERVLRASAPGRGRPDLELVGATPSASPAAAFGPAPVDPADLPADELVRVSALLVARAVVAADPADRPDDLAHIAADARARWQARTVRWRPWRTRYRLAGDPWLAEHWRHDLRRRGRPPGGGEGAETFVLASDLPTMLADLWTDRAFSTRAPVPGWSAFLAGLAEHDRLPRGIDTPRAVRHWLEKVGGHRVRLVVDHDALPGLVGVRRLPPPERPGADAVELARRVSSSLGLLVTPDRGRRLLRQVLLPTLVAAPGPALAIPPEQHRWVARRSRRLVRDLPQELRRSHYAVVGDPASLGVRARDLARAEPGLPDVERVLGLACRVLLAGPTTRRGGDSA